MGNDPHDNKIAVQASYERLRKAMETVTGEEDLLVHPKVLTAFTAYIKALRRAERLRVIRAIRNLR